MSRRAPSLRQSSGQRELRHEVTDKVRKLAHIGSGAYGSVHLVQYRCPTRGGTRINAVLKEVPLQNEDARQAAMDEVLHLAELSHPNIIGYHESYCIDGKLNIIMEYANGDTLEDQVRKATREGRRVDAAKVKKWLTQLLLAVGHIHVRHILHRDIKTANVFLHNDNIKLGDFGVAQELDSTAGLATSVKGTPYYLSHEVVNGNSYSYPADMWAVGVVLYRLCANAYPFPGKNICQLSLKISSGQYAPLDADAVDSELRDCVKGLLETDPAVRLTARGALGRPWVQAMMDRMGMGAVVTPKKGKGGGGGGGGGGGAMRSPPGAPASAPLPLQPPPLGPPPPPGGPPPTPPPSRIPVVVVATPPPPRGHLRESGRLQITPGGSEAKQPKRGRGAAALPRSRTASESSSDEETDELTKTGAARERIADNQEALRKSMSRRGLEMLGSRRRRNPSSNGVGIRERARGSGKKRMRPARTPRPGPTPPDDFNGARSVRPNFDVSEFNLNLASLTLNSTGGQTSDGAAGAATAAAPAAAAPAAAAPAAAPAQHPERFGMGDSYRASAGGAIGSHGDNPFGSHHSSLESSTGGDSLDSTGGSGGASGDDDLRRASQLFDSPEHLRQVADTVASSSASSASESDSDDQNADSSNTPVAPLRGSSGGAARKSSVGRASSDGRPSVTTVTLDFVAAVRNSNESTPPRFSFRNRQSASAVGSRASGAGAPPAAERMLDIPLSMVIGGL